MSILEKPLMMIINHLTPSCDVITEKISESMDHKIPLSDRIKIRLHIMVCKFCARFREQMLLIRNALEKEPLDFEDVLCDVHLTSEQKTHIKLALKEQEKKNS